MFFIHNNAEAEAQGVTRMPRRITRQRGRMRVTPLGFRLRVVVHEKPQNLEKTTSSVLSVLLLIYDLTDEI